LHYNSVLYKVLLHSWPTRVVKQLVQYFELGKLVIEQACQMHGLVSSYF